MVKEINEQIVNVVITGKSPYVQHRFPEEDDDKKGKRGTSIPTPEEECEKSVYRNENGYFIPAKQIKAAMVSAAKEFKLKGKKSFKEFIQAGIIMEQEEIPLNDEKGKKIKDYEIFKEPVVIQRARIMRSRPLFKNWSAEFQIKIIDTMINPDHIQNILEAAGKYKGIGDRRPEKGRFEITTFKLI